MGPQGALGTPPPRETPRTACDDVAIAALDPWKHAQLHSPLHKLRRHHVASPALHHFLGQPNSAEVTAPAHAVAQPLHEALGRRQAGAVDHMHLQVPQLAEVWQNTVSEVASVLVQPPARCWTASKTW